MRNQDKVVCFGELMLRLSAPGYTRLLQDGKFDASFGGAEANVAVLLSQLGLKSDFVSVLPGNAFGKAAKKELAYYGVGIENISMSDGRMGLYFSEKGISQRPSVVIYDRNDSAFSKAKPSDFDWELIFSDAKWFHWTGITAALSNNMPTIIENACVFAKDNGITISCDLNYRGKLWDGQKARSVMTKLIPYTDICIGNEEDAEKVLGIKLGNSDVDSGVIDLKDYEIIAEQIAIKYGCRKVAFTLRESFSANRNGWSGMLYSSEEKRIYKSKKYDITVLDRIGGGDSFSAGLIYGLIIDMPNQDTIDFAAAAGCLAHTIEGDFNQCDLEEIKALQESFGSGRIQR